LRIKFGNAYSRRKRIDTALKPQGDEVVKAISTRNLANFGKQIAA
jgi:hypothetical protein